MKIYILFEKKSYGDGDIIKLVSKNKLKLTKKMKELFKEYYDVEEVTEVEKPNNDYCIVYYDNGDFVQLTIETHEVI